jgi:hypothetical protein
MEIGKIYGSICDIMGDIGAISKDKTNSQQGYKFRGVDDVYGALQPVLVKHRVFPVPMILEERREDKLSSKGNALIYTILRMKYRLYADDGSFVECEVIGEGMDSGDKSANKAMSVAYKYAMFQLLCIPTEAVDPDSESHTIAPPAKAPAKALRPDLNAEPEIKEPDNAGSKATAEQVEVLRKTYVGANLTKLMTKNGITRLEDISFANADRLIKQLSPKAPPAEPAKEDFNFFKKQTA